MSKSAVVEVWNFALGHLGQPSVGSLTDTSRNGRVMAKWFNQVRDALFEAYRWDFAIVRATLNALASAPVHGRAYAYQLPPDFVRLLPAEDECTDGLDDRNIEGDKIVTDATGPIKIVYVASVEASALWSPSFITVLALDLAIAGCREITNSTTLKESLKSDRRDAIREAKRIKAIQRRPQAPRTDSWVEARAGYVSRRRDGWYA